MSLKNMYTVIPNEITPGDIFAVTVTCYVTPNGVKIYRCPFPAPDTADGIPQGMHYDPNMRILDLFPSVRIWKEGD